MIRRILTAIDKAELALAMLCLSSFTIIIFVAALTRVFKHPLNWSADIALFLFAWTTFLGADVAYRNGRLVNVDIVIKNFPRIIQKVAAVVIYAVILAFLACMVFYGIRLCGTTRHRTFNGVPGFSYMWVTISIPISCFLMGITSVDRLIGLLRAPAGKEISKM